MTTHSSIKGINGYGASSNENLSGLKIRNRDIGSKFQKVGAAETGQDDGSASSDDESASRRRHHRDSGSAELRKPHGCSSEKNQEAKKTVGVPLFRAFSLQFNYMRSDDVDITIPT